MTEKQAIIHLNQINREQLPHYYDYASAIEKIKALLVKKVGEDLTLYHSEDDVDELLEVVNQMLVDHDPEIEVLAPVYASVSTAHFKYSAEERYQVAPSLINNLFYFPSYQVAACKIPVFQSHKDFEETFIFAKNDQALVAFLNYLIEKQRQYMMEGVTVFTDTDEGVVKTKEKITHQIRREDILLDEHVKTDIFRSIDEFFFKSGTFFKTYNIPYKRGILLYGSPGNGKTTLVKSIAGSVAAPIVYWQITENTSSYTINEVFSIVTRMAPMVLVIEDIDSMPDYARSTFLNSLDGATSKEGIFLIGTTNYPEQIDPALINRAGRFDRAYEIKQPTGEIREKYLRKKGLSNFLDEASLHQLVEKTNGLSIAQLNEIYMSIALEWHYEQQVNIDKIVADLQANQRKTIRQEWEDDEYSTKVGF